MKTQINKIKKKINESKRKFTGVSLFTIIFLLPSIVFSNNILSGNSIDGWTKIEAENCNSSGPVTFANNNGIICFTADNPWVQYNDVDFHDATNYVRISVLNKNETANIQLIAGDIIVDTLSIENTGTSDLFKNLVFKLNSSISGIKNLKLVFLSGTVNIDWFLFSNEAPKKQRIVVSTDFPPLDVCMSGCAADHTSDPDDVQSMVRFLLYSNEFDVEGLIASSGTFANVANKQNILDIINLYDKVDENLRTHDTEYPTADALRSITYQGRNGTWGGTVANNIGSGKDSEASEAIIRIVDKTDIRPVWFSFWGDCSNLAQAIWKVKSTRNTTEFNTFLSKIRIFQIAHQDSTIDWMMNNFPDLFIIYSNSTYQGVFGGTNDNLGNLNWLNTNIRQNHGVLGEIYPPAAMGVDGLKEGDSPSFMYLISATHGLNNPEIPSQESWGGQYVRSGNTNHWIDGVGTSSISKWKAQYQAEFALRADWMISSSNFIQTIDNKNDKVNIFPNPIKNELNIKSEIDFSSLQIYNTEGKLMLEKQFSKEIRSISLPVNLPKGFYLLKLSNENSCICRKIVVE